MSTPRALRRGRVLAGVAYVLLCGVGFFGVSAAFRPLVPWPNEYGLEEKFLHLEEHADDYDVVFLGSSHLWRGIIPELFDEVMAEEGWKVRSFNFGVGGMREWEMDYVFHRILELDSDRLRWIFVEGGDWEPGFPKAENTFASRTVSWHDATETRQAIEATWTADIGWRERLRLTVTHLQLFLMKKASYGMGRQVVLEKRGLRVVDHGGVREKGEYLKSEGFQTQDKLVHPEFRRKSEEYTDAVRALMTSNYEDVDLEHVYVGALRGQHAAAEEHGVEVITLVPPQIDSSAVRRALHANGEIEVLFDFNRPDVYPEQFRIKGRFSPDHLNANGADVFTRELARTFARHLRGEVIE